MVGRWAALDAFAERAALQSQCPTCRRNCIVEAYKSKFQGAERQTFEELEDLRHLFAHNYAGEADEEYLDRAPHVLKRGDPGKLSCGAIFDDRRLCRQNGKTDLTRSHPLYTVNAPRLSPQYDLNLSDLRMYSCTVQSVLRRCP